MLPSEREREPLIDLLFVEDDARLASLTREYLQRHGVVVTVEPDGNRGLRSALTHRYDVVLLDLMLPARSGLEVCQRLREQSDVPIVMVTARGEEADRVLGLELGADDYVAKPFSPRELLARVRAVVRRARGQAGPSRRPVAAGGLVLDPASRVAELEGRPLELLGNVSHEFRTPLSRLRVALEMCEEEEEPGTLRAHLPGILRDVAELEALVADVLTATRLDLAREEGAKLPLDRAPVDLGELAREAALRFARNHPEHELRVTGGERTRVAAADGALLRRVFDNLLENAARYSEPGAAVELRLGVEPRGVAAEVADRGIGVAEEDLPRLFEPFFRTERSRSRSAGGTGLGLTLCRRIAEAHGGTIAASPNPDGGLIVRFRLPA